MGLPGRCSFTANLLRLDGVDRGSIRDFLLPLRKEIIASISLHKYCPLLYPLSADSLGSYGFFKASYACQVNRCSDHHEPALPRCFHAEL
ncbi:hypothetical protein VFPPC_16123 [Pochonia chlamydosporia 170]|uniref:Uncharacterized protein n=1 Tax=Pochonia chlamydosporia 170 TaxID=1380566 RepID=A0A179FP53_METCM|nr:hypothetical protein VFPPC_16123 [Pochonia chlamydosporia 170]OAQ67137.1 hypothetical protein VFPPC_16123 [Pochonia chlamydosporia 170]